MTLAVHRARMNPDGRGGGRLLSDTVGKQGGVGMGGEGREGETCWTQLGARAGMDRGGGRGGMLLPEEVSS